MKKLRFKTGFAGLPSVRPTTEQLARAHDSMRKHYRDRRAAQRLDEVLGPVDDEEDFDRAE